MQSCDIVGYVASGLVLATFAMNDIVKLRMVAIGSNVVFLAYGLTMGLAPIWILHAILLPMNLWRLSQLLGLDNWIWATDRLFKVVAGKVR